MVKQKIEEAIVETQQCIVQYWLRDISYVSQRFALDIMWIGAVETEYLQGREEVIRELNKTNSTNPVCHLLQQEFWCVANDLNSCIIIGRYLVTSDNSCGEIHQEQQRATFAWKQEREGIRIAHMHISQPIGYLEAGELFPHKIGRLSYEYLQSLIGRYEGKWKRIKVKDLNGHIYFLSEAEIEYAEAKNHNTIIGIIKSSLVSRIEWKDFQNKLGSDFVKVHRSFVINRRYIKVLGIRDIEMVSGAKIPVPLKRKKEIYERIAAAIYKQ